MGAVPKCLFIFVSIGYFSFPILSALPTESVEFSVIEVKEAYEEQQLSVKSPEIGRNITIVGNDFIRDGKVQRIMSGSLHYFRVPAEYWRDRLQKVKAAGLNTVSTYVEWSFHEPEEGQTLFEGDQDLVQFIKIAEEEGLLVLLRPGPYICAERDLGGLPYWLLSKYPNIRLRTQDEDFIKETKIWMSKLFAQVEPLLYGKGGPIILVQVENEYGSYGSDKVYMGKIRDIIKEHVGSNALLYTTDGYSKGYFFDGSISGTLTTVDFGTTNDVKKNFKDLREFMPVGPLMNSEYYPGWLTHWSETIQQVSTDDVVKTLKDLLRNNMHFNFYMFFGGTNFEFTAGANYGSYYQPDITSYDYDAPMTEAGDPSPKYIAIRNALIEYNPEAAQIPEPVASKKGAYGKLIMGSKVSLLSTEGRQSLGVTYKDVSGSKLPTFEELRQRGGLVLYETTLQNETDGILQIKEPRDWIFVFIDNVLQGVINRMQKLFTLSMKAKAGARLSLLVENQGRINYGKRIHDFKGILSPVTINNKSLDEKWSITGFPLNIKNNFTSFESEQITSKREPVLYEGLLTLPDGEEPLETFVDPTGWGKGYIFVNGHNLGRYWPSVGPQVTLYVPGVWLKKAPAQNVIQIVELQEASEELSIEFIDHPILNRTGNINQYFGKHLISYNTHL